MSKFACYRLLENKFFNVNYLVKGKNVFNPSNKNYLVETIVLRLLYVIYGSTTLVIANLICLANIPIPDLTIYHLEQSLTASCSCYWSTGLTKRKLPIQQAQVSTYYKHGGLCQRSKETKSAYYCTYSWISGIQQLPFKQFLLNSCDLCMKQLDYCKIVEKNFNFVAQGILERT